ncbi:protein MAIN-LIKE 1 [Lathyrus oleraceus]|nr:protein MAIN-LIKE 1-like [Pisum sativum]
MLTEYAYHVALRLWQREDHIPLKVTSHRSKLKDFPKISMPDQVRRIVWYFELLNCTHCSLTMLNALLLTTFVERWHKETSSFHLQFGKMTISLDDVSSLFYLPIRGRFWTNHVLNSSFICMTATQDLGVSKEAVQKGFAFNRDTHLYMSWLQNTYVELVAAGSYEVVARMYMLHLITCTLFADNSGVYIDMCACSVASRLPIGLRGVLY